MNRDCKMAVEWDLFNDGKWMGEGFGRLWGGFWWAGIGGFLMGFRIFGISLLRIFIRWELIKCFLIDSRFGLVMMRKLGLGGVGVLDWIKLIF